MKVKCIHGYFIFDEILVGEISDFSSRYGLTIVPSYDHFTFEFLEDAPKYSIEGGEYLGATAIATFEGEPWEVMRANGLVYDFTSGAVVPISTITQRASVNAAGRYYISNGLIIPGSLTDEGERVTDYSAHYSNAQLNFRYSEVTYG